MIRILKIEVIILLLIAPYSLGGVKKVPSDYLTIQAAIDDSNDGDCVLVAPGTYTGEGNRDIDFRGKAITVKSQDGPEACIIDSQGTEDNPHRGFFFHSNEDANSILEGFTITNGCTIYPTMGGGIYCDASSPCINNCIVSENSAPLGGGIACKDSNAVITDCVIIGNSAVTSKGGGIFCINASPHILDCLIAENTAFGYGGGVKCDYSNPTITRCVIRNNAAEAGGGVGIGTRGGVPSQLKMIYCLITGNTSTSRGGGIHALGEISLLNCIIFGNRSDFNGGGIYLGVDPRIINNSIIYGNIIPGATGSEISQNPPGAGGCEPRPIKIKHSVVGSDPNAIYMPRCYSIEWLHADPLFANPGYWDANGTPVCETIIAGDINGDCKVDFNDLILMAAHWLQDNTP